jgi:hypothetical protein
MQAWEERRAPLASDVHPKGDPLMVKWLDASEDRAQ